MRISSPPNAASVLVHEAKSPQLITRELKAHFSDESWDFCRTMLEPLITDFSQMDELPVRGGLIPSVIELLYQTIESELRTHPTDNSESLAAIVALAALERVTPQHVTYFADVLSECFEFVDHDTWEHAASLMPTFVLDAITRESRADVPFSPRTRGELKQLEVRHLNELRNRARTAQAHHIAAHIQARIFEASLCTPEERLSYAADLRRLGDRNSAECMARISRILFRRTRDAKGERDAVKFINGVNGAAAGQKATMQKVPQGDVAATPGTERAPCYMEQLNGHELVVFSAKLKAIGSLDANEQRVRVEQLLVERDGNSPKNRNGFADALAAVGRSNESFEQLMHAFDLAVPNALFKDRISVPLAATVTLLRDHFIEPARRLTKDILANTPNVKILSLLPEDKLLEAAEQNAEEGNLDRAVSCYAILDSHNPDSYKYKFIMADLLGQNKMYDDALIMHRGAQAILELVLRGLDRRSFKSAIFSDGAPARVAAINEVRTRIVEVVADRQNKRELAELAKKGV